ncbi:MAG: GNAT family N-acetyltransferase [Eubacteriales bacterium]
MRNKSLIRPMVKTDSRWLETFLYLAVHVPAGQKPYPKSIIKEPSIDIYIKDYGKPDDVGFVADQDGEVVGMAFSRILAGPEVKGYGNIDANTPELLISVLPDYRGQGIGSRLVKALHAELAGCGYARISLSVQKTNPAVTLYTRMGYNVIEEQDDDYIMIKQLT